MNMTLKHCDCPEPVETAQQFCDLCGAEYQEAPLVSRDRLAAGDTLAQYQVVERQRMWALLADAEGKRYRFWPAGDTTSSTPPLTEKSDVLTEHKGPLESAPESLPEAPDPEVTSPATQAEAGLASPSDPIVEDSPASDSQPDEPDGFPEEAETSPSPESAGQPAASPSPASAPESSGTGVTEAPAEPAVPETPPEPVSLRHFTFLQGQAVNLEGIPGYLEPERPEKFTGTEVRSLRSLMDADPAGLDTQPVRLLSWLIQCAQAMKSAHEQGVLVNSFTPDTVFVDFDPAAIKSERVAISTCLHAAPFDRAHPVAGYAPQSTEPLSPRTDVYQIGALLRDLMGWSPELLAEGEMDLLQRPMPLVRLVLQLMHHDAGRRPPEADALKKLLLETQQAFVSQHVLSVAGVTDMGLNREHNEDAYGFLQFEEQAGKGQLSTTILVVCDGVGGSNAGEEASRLAVHEMLAFLSASAGSSRPVQARLEEAILQANTKLLDLSREHRGAGCTVVAVYVRGQEYWVAHAGDSRAYVCVDGVLTPLTGDHSWTAQQVRKGLLTQQEAQEHENAHMIYRSLGERDRLEVEIQPATGTGFPLEPGAVFLLCTDGVTDVLDDAHLRTILSSNSRIPRDKARHCVQAANAAGGPDNITALIAIQEVTL